ncbi:MAG TPA: hypothetical protein VNA20_07765 [Frankiaceae bacterium]|nr:hypothetical protein [Frankiaceae bacterium]
MRASALFAAAALAGALAAPPAVAHPDWDYTGGCEVTVKYEPATGEYRGEARVHVVATNTMGVPAPTTVIAVQCRFRHNGVAQGVVVEWSGVGAVALVAPVSMHVDLNDTYTVCDFVTVGGEAHPEVCHDITVIG